MTTKNMAYDHPAYLARVQHAFGQNTAGANTAFSKFVAFAALQVFGVTAALITSGTSTYTAWNGTATTTAITGDSFSLIHVSNSAAIGATPVLTTNTHGPYSLSLYNGTATATQTTVAGAFVTVALGTNTGAGAPTPTTGGFTVNQGDTIHILRGTDATAVSAYALEYGVLPLTNVTA
jgi:hypothetical protein